MRLYPIFLKKLYQLWTPPKGGFVALVAREFIPWANGNIYDLVHDLIWDNYLVREKLSAFLVVLESLRS
jgi:hypothetical protein